MQRAATVWSRSGTSHLPVCGVETRSGTLRVPDPRAQTLDSLPNNRPSYRKCVPVVRRSRIVAGC